MRIYIAEDEPLAAAKLKLFLEKLDEGQDVSHFSDGEKLIAALSETPPDLLFMDIQMPIMTGLEVLERIGDHAYPIILTTAFDRYAIDGFNFGVTDYLLKPYTLDRLRTALLKAKMMILLQSSGSETISKQNSQTSSITVRCEGRNELVEISAIESLEALKDYTQLSLTDGRKLITLGTLSLLEKQLPEDLFVRVQRSYVVNLKLVKSYSSISIELLSGQEIPIGKTYRESFLSALQAANQQYTF